MENIYSNMRKDMQAAKEAPDWYTTGAMQLFMQGYSFNEESPKSRMQSIAKALAKHAPKTYPDFWEEDPYTKGKNWEQVFFQVMWDGFVGPSTPLMRNGGVRKRGTTVSCSSGYMGNNIYDRYNILTEAAVLTKHSHGTSYSITDWPAEGDPLKKGGNSLGVMPVIRDLIEVMEEVTQGGRRGSVLYSLAMDHGDFYKALDFAYKNPESNNPAWIMTDKFNERLLNYKDKDAEERFLRSLQVKLEKGRGNYSFIDKMNRHLAAPFKDKGMTAKSTNLCCECIQPSDDENTYSCVILNYNLEVYRQWPKHLVFIGQVMSDCNVSEYLETIDEMSIQDQRAMQKIRNYTERFRPLGSGVIGFHTLMQKERIVVGSLESMYLNTEIFKHLDQQSKEATQWLAGVFGEPSGCVGYGIRNATRLMMPPTKSSSELLGGASEGIGLDLNMVFTKQSAGGEIFRVNKVLVEIMKERGVFNNDEIMKLAKNRTVRGCGWLDEHEEKVFRNAFEVPQDAYLRLCSQRQRYIDQGQSINLYFTSADSPEYIAKTHRQAIQDEGILNLYYIYSMRGSGMIQRVVDCENCQ